MSIALPSATSSCASFGAERRGAVSVEAIRGILDSLDLQDPSRTSRPCGLISAHLAAAQGLCFVPKTSAAATIDEIAMKNLFLEGTPTQPLNRLWQQSDVGTYIRPEQRNSCEHADLEHL